MAIAQAVRAAVAAVAGVLAMTIADGAAAQNSCSLLVFAPDRTDERIVDAAPAEGSVCYALGLEPGREIRLALTGGSNTVFGVAGVVQDERRHTFTSGAGIHEIHLYQRTGGRADQEFVLTIHADPLPPPSAVADAPPVAAEPGEGLAADGNSDPAAVAEGDPVVPTGAAPVQPTLAPSADERVYGPGWTVSADDTAGTLTFRGTATNYTTVLTGRCGAGLAAGLHVGLSGLPAGAIRQGSGSSATIRLVLTAADGSVATFDTVLVHDVDTRTWRTQQPLPVRYYEAFGHNIVMKLVAEQGAQVATFLLYGTREAADWMHQLCVTTGVAASAMPSPQTSIGEVATPPHASLPADSGSASEAMQGSTAPRAQTAVPAMPETQSAPEHAASASGWRIVVETGVAGVVAQGVAVDGVTGLEVSCGVTLPAGIHLLLQGGTGSKIGLGDRGGIPVYIEIAAGNEPPQVVDAMLSAVSGGGGWRTQVPLPYTFALAVGHGSVMTINAADGRQIALFFLAGTGMARDIMRQVCRF